MFANVGQEKYSEVLTLKHTGNIMTVRYYNDVIFAKCCNFLVI